MLCMIDCLQWCIMSISDCCCYLCPSSHVWVLIELFFPQRSETVTGRWCKNILVLISHQWWLFLSSYLSQWRCFRKWQRFLCFPCMLFPQLIICRSHWNWWSYLQFLWQLMEYSYLLDQADKCDDPYMRMVYACKYFLSSDDWLCITVFFWGKV